MSDDRPALSNVLQFPKSRWVVPTEALLPSRLQAYKLVNGDLLLVGHYGDDSVLIKSEDVGPFQLWLNRSYK